MPDPYALQWAMKTYGITREEAVAMEQGRAKYDRALTKAMKDADMPKGTKVDKMYRAIRRSGASKGKAARIAQSKTGKNLKTGRKPKRKK